MSDLEYDLVIVGAGSGNMLPDESTRDWRTAVVETDRFGGTCLNRGCIPSTAVDPGHVPGKPVDEVASGVLYIHPR